MKKVLALLAVFVLGVVVGVHGGKCPVLRKCCPAAPAACCDKGCCGNCDCGDQCCCCVGCCKK